MWKQDTQFLCAVSSQLAVGYINRDRPCFNLMMCLRQDRGSNKLTMSKINGTNGKPKEFIPIIHTNTRLRRIKRTMGSTESISKKVLTCSVERPVDGGSVVPRVRRKLSSGRDPGKLRKNKRNAPVKGVPPKLISQKKVDSIVKRWKEQEKIYTGVQVPPKYAKIIKIGKNTRSTFDDIYSLVLTPEMYDLAYGKVKSNPGMMTPGTSEETLTGWGPEIVFKLISELSTESFQFSKFRTKNIPKPQGGQRGLKIAPPRDKIIQRVITDILEAIYEPSFSKHSFGFRQNLGCHDALQYIKKKYQGTRWFIEGDIAKCFDTIDHHILIRILRRRIKDERFIRLIWKTLRAGYLDTFKVPQDCLIGTPQGSIVSPILCNILMNEFDKYMEETIFPSYNRGIARQQPPEYKRAMANAYRFMKKHQKTQNPTDLAKSKEYRALAQNMPSTDTKDPNFRRLYYTRYADDWIVGFAGPHCEAKEIRELIRSFLAELGLELNLEKTTITSGSEGCIFLGTKIHVPLNEERFKKAKYKSRANLGVRLNAPIKRVIEKLAAAGYCNKNGFPTPRMSLYAADKAEIISYYTDVYRGILNYYSFADNYVRLAYSVFSILRNSAAKLLAAKLKLRTVRQVLLKFGPLLGKVEGNHLPTHKELDSRNPLFKLGGGVPRIPLFRKASLTIRIQNIACIVCGSTYKVEMHHTRLLKDLNKKMDPISRAMAARKRKQVPLCKAHHTAQHVNINNISRAAMKRSNKNTST